MRLNLDLAMTEEETKGFAFEGRLRKFFLRDCEFGLKYSFQLKHILENPREIKPRLIIDLGDLREYNSRDVHRLLRAPIEMLPHYEKVIYDLAVEHIASMHHKEAKLIALKVVPRLQIGFTGPFGHHYMTPRELLSPFLASMIKLEGIVTAASLVTPKLQKSTHFCPATKRQVIQTYPDLSSNMNNALNSSYPTKDDHGNQLLTEYGLCVYVDFQTITVQEVPEIAPPGQLPRSVEVVVQSDLVDLAKPGDRVSVVGVFNEVQKKAVGKLTGLFKAVVFANHIEILSGGQLVSNITLSEVQTIHNFVTKLTEPIKKERTKSHGNRIKMLDMLASSYAPSIYGHEMIKRALILQLIGGVGKALDSGLQLRGDINILLMGDPGVAKSQLLRGITQVSPLVVSTTGRGATGVGLTAAVTRDKETGDRRLEAGAMVLADKGVVLIDEFDKMSDSDRVAMHEVMEQQTVTITKAGLHVTLNARCTVLAAANPLYGSYDYNLSVPQNINMSDSLLSRFDLLFIMTDQITSEQDRDIARHILAMRALASPIHKVGAITRNIHQSILQTAETSTKEVEEVLDRETKIFVSRKQHPTTSKRRSLMLKSTFLRKFVSYIRNKPVEPSGITCEAQKKIIKFYSELRARRRDGSGIPITARTLETIIRLASANAKICLDYDTISEKDISIAEMLLRTALLGEYWEPLTKEPPGMHASVAAESHTVEKLPSWASFTGKLKESIDVDHPSTTPLNKKAFTDISERERYVMLSILSSLSDRKNGMVTFCEFSRATRASELRISDPQILSFLQQQDAHNNLFLSM